MKKLIIVLLLCIPIMAMAQRLVPYPYSASFYGYIEAQKAIHDSLIYETSKAYDESPGTWRWHRITNNLKVNSIIIGNPWDTLSAMPDTMPPFMIGVTRIDTVPGGGLLFSKGIEISDTTASMKIGNITLTKDGIVSLCRGCDAVDIAGNAVIDGDLDVGGDLSFSNSASLESDDFTVTGEWNMSTLYLPYNPEFYAGADDAARINAALSATGYAKLTTTYTGTTLSLNAGTLEFTYGGSLENFDTIIFNNTFIINPDVHQIFDAITFSGTIKNKVIDAAWFGDSGEAILTAVKLCDKVQISNSYNFDTKPNINSNTELTGGTNYAAWGTASLSANSATFTIINRTLGADTGTIIQKVEDFAIAPVANAYYRLDYDVISNDPYMGAIYPYRGYFRISSKFASTTKNWEIPSTVGHHSIVFKSNNNPTIFGLRVSYGDSIVIVIDNIELKLVDLDFDDYENKCIEFVGGDIIDANSIAGNNTSIINNSNKQIFSNEIISGGSWNVPFTTPEWAGGYASDGITDRKAIQSMLDFGNKQIKLENGSYTIDSTINIGTYYVWTSSEGYSLYMNSMSSISITKDYDLFHINTSVVRISGGELLSTVKGGNTKDFIKIIGRNSWDFMGSSAGGKVYIENLFITNSLPTVSGNYQGTAIRVMSGYYSDVDIIRNYQLTFDNIKITYFDYGVWYDEFIDGGTGGSGGTFTNLRMGAVKKNLTATYDPLWTEMDQFSLVTIFGLKVQAGSYTDYIINWQNNGLRVYSGSWSDASGTDTLIILGKYSNDNYIDVFPTYPDKQFNFGVKYGLKKNIIVENYDEQPYVDLTNAYKFDGTGYIEGTLETPLNVKDGDYTAMIRFYSDINETLNFLFSLTNITSNGLLAEFTIYDQVRYYYKNNTEVVKITSSIIKDGWNLISVTKQDDLYSIYANGYLIDTTTMTIAPTLTSSSAFRIGSLGTKTFNGYVSDFILLDSALTETDIDLFNNPKKNILSFIKDIYYENCLVSLTDNKTESGWIDDITNSVFTGSNFELIGKKTTNPTLSTLNWIPQSTLPTNPYIWTEAFDLYGNKLIYNGVYWDTLYNCNYTWYSENYGALYDSYTTKPNVEYARNCDTLFYNLESSGIYDSLSYMLMFVAPNNTNNLTYKNWINPLDAAITTVGGVTFYADSGLVTNGSNAYIITPFIANSDSKFDKDSHSILIGVVNAEHESSYAFGSQNASGLGRIALVPYVAGKDSAAFYNTYYTAHYVDNVGSPDGYFGMTRRSSSGFKIYVNTDAPVYKTQSSAAGTELTYPFYLSSYNNAGYPASYLGTTTKVFVCGDELGETKMDLLISYIEEFLDKYNSGIIP